MTSMEAARAELPAAKTERYAALRREIAAVIAGEPNVTARYATAASMLVEAFGERFFWCGFYVADPDKKNELVVGPYQGTLGCLRIPFGKGVCGAAAAARATQLVPDVHAFPGHIACDAASNSELVVPIVRDGQLLAYRSEKAKLLQRRSTVQHGRAAGPRSFQVMVSN